MAYNTMAVPGWEGRHYGGTDDEKMPEPPREHTAHMDRLEKATAGWQQQVAQWAEQRTGLKHELQRASHERDDLTRYIERLEAQLSALIDCIQRGESVGADVPTPNGMIR